MILNFKKYFRSRLFKVKIPFFFLNGGFNKVKELRKDGDITLDYFWLNNRHIQNFFQGGNESYS